MAQLKVYSDKNYVPFYPGYVRVALNAPTHHNQGHYLVVAHSKAEALDVLDAQGFSPTKSNIGLADLRSNWTMALGEAGQLRDPGTIFVSELNGPRVVKVDGQRQAEVIGSVPFGTSEFVPVAPVDTRDDVRFALDAVCERQACYPEGHDLYEAFGTAARVLREKLENL